MKKIILNTLLLVVLFGCSSTSNLPKTIKLGTTSKSQNYIYCESCPAPTKLDNQVYQPLEPDEPILDKAPIIAPIIITNHHRSTVKRKKHKKHHKKPKSKPQPKQCLEWSK